MQLRFQRRTRPPKNLDPSHEESVKGPPGLSLLHASPEPLIDLIFVHGLKGDSIKTWRKGRDQSTFWPQYWLPMDPDFKHASIHSFGYDCDWKSTKSSILDIFDFGNSLLEALRTSPYLRAHPKAPIVLIGHSMGGLVIKKAYITAREDEQHPELAQRMQCIFFLATPHRGSNYATTLNNILKISGFAAPKQYLEDLNTGSTSTQIINESFAKFADDLAIFSFFETLQMDVKLSTIFVVDKTSAILGPGFKTERVQHLDANHQNICKFESLKDPNYIRVRDSLSAAIDDLLYHVKTTRTDQVRSQTRLLQTFLGMKDAPELVDTGCIGSCRWIEERVDFQNWREWYPQDSSGYEPAYYVVTANPGAGKTVLAAHIISQLQDFNLECAFHFFGVKGAQSLGALLRSLAYQMAVSNSTVRDVLIKLCNEGATFDKDDARVIWNKIFKKGIFQERILSPQYWVIDAVDECTRYQELFTMLRDERPSFPLRVFITSRKIPNLPKLLKTLRPDLEPLEIPASDTLHDIAAYIKTRADCFNVETDSEREELSKKLLSKSDASFLWVRLVLDELERVYGYESITEVLEGTPEGMIPFYQRSVSLLSEKREKNTIKAILAWVIASFRPLHISELSQALQLDVKAQLPSSLIKTAIEGLCCNLVSVDGNDTIRLIHMTAREFLLSEDAGEFRIKKSVAHERIGLICLKLLSSPELQPPKHRRFLNQKRPPPTALSTYAKKHFSDHVFAASSEKEDLHLAVDRFLRNYAVSWVEHLARMGDLHSITRTARNLKAFLDRGAKYRSPLNKEHQSIERWCTDLTRVVTHFGSALLTSPSSIYFLIPPLAPVESALSRFGVSLDGLTLVGHRDATWPDCVSTVNLGEEITSTVACGSNLVAVGTLSGSLNLYNDHTLQKSHALAGRFAIDHAHFDRTGKFLAASSTRQLTVWDLSGNKIWENRLRHPLILLDSTQDTILGLTSHGYLRQWKTTSGELIKEKFYPSEPEADQPSRPSPFNRKTPSLAAISADGQTMAIAYRNHPIRLWSLHSDDDEDEEQQQADDLIGYAVDDKGREPFRILFNPNPDVDVFLVGYRDCHLALFDSNSGASVQSDDEHSQVGLLSATASPDGRTLATVDLKGCMRIWDFETLGLLYYVTSYNSLSRTLRFTSDSSRIIDAADSYIRAWSPAVLVRKTIDDDMSTSEKALDLPVIEGQYEALQDSRISVTCAHPSDRVVFAGRDDGQVVRYDSKTGEHRGFIYSHPNNARVTALAINSVNILASGDVLGNLRVWTLSSNSQARSGQVQQEEKLLFKAQFTKPVRQLIFSTNGNYMLASTAAKAEVFAIEGWSSARSIGSIHLDPEHSKPGTWLANPATAPTNPQMYLIEDKTLKVFEIEGFGSNQGSIVGILDYEVPSDAEEIGIINATVHPASQILVLDTRRRCRYVTLSSLLLFSLESLPEAQSHPPHLRPLAVTGLLVDRVRQMVTMPTGGEQRRASLSQKQPTDSLFFLTQNSWLSSLDLQAIRSGSAAATASYNRHFYVPTDFVTQEGDEIVPVRTVDDEIVFSVHGEIAIIKNGLKFQELQTL
ncbi:hypothetical protein CC79DRAFT_1277034 [Sarocladium strictum]